mmetsp:Transcript_28125/g.61093  ORF Transcript_28125/g.61093 Transcript_28125/m.61093 type:complete len:104 (+) Transcript_28125:1449-1760(+)
MQKMIKSWVLLHLLRRSQRAPIRKLLAQAKPAPQKEQETRLKRKEEEQKEKGGGEEGGAALDASESGGAEGADIPQAELPVAESSGQESQPPTLPIPPKVAET